jgi:dipeptidyl aminopeptidase/acylaminoacyl peptidase
LALEVVKDEQRTIVVQDLVARKILTGVRMGEVKFRGLEWAGDNHLILETSTTSGIFGLLSQTNEWFQIADFNLVTHKLTPLMGDVDKTMNIVLGSPMIRVIGGEPYLFVQGSQFTPRIADQLAVEYLIPHVALFKIDLRDDASRLMPGEDPDANRYIVDADGHALAESTYNAHDKVWRLKVWRDGSWRVAQSQSAPIESPSLLGLGRDGKSILLRGFGDDRYALREVSPDGATVGSRLDGPESGQVLHDPVTHRLIGVAALTGDELAYRFYDPAEDLRWRGIEAAFRGQQVELVSSSDDRQKLILHIDSPTEGPGFVLVDLTNHSSQWMGSDYPGLAPADISEVRPLRFKAADGLDLSGYLTLPKARDAKNLPLVVFPHGGPAARDQPGFDWWAQAMASHGYAVLQVNYRGSDGFGWDFLSAGFGQWGRKMQTDLSDGVRYLATQGTIDPKRVCIVGASYGGYAALAGATKDAGVYRCAVDVSGPAELGKFIEWAKARGGDWGATTARYWDRFVGAKDPGDPQLQSISPADLAGKVTIPILIIHGKDDTVVPFEQSQLMADALGKASKPYDFVVLNHEDHWLSRSDTRLQMLQATIDFLEKNNPPRLSWGARRNPVASGALADD